MTRLQFTIPQIDPATRSSPALPVNVHRAQDFAIVSRSVTGQDFLLAPGDYVAVVHFPDGLEAFQTFHLKDGEKRTVELHDIAQEIAGHPSLDRVAETQWTSPLPYNFIDFNPHRDHVDVLSKSRKFAAQMEVSTPNGDQWRYLAVAPESRTVEKLPSVHKTYLIAVPAPERARVTVTLKFNEIGVPHPDFLMPRVAATLLYRYLSKGAPEAATRLAGSAELLALDLVDHKAEDPISGALGMYLLLNIGKVEDIGQRSEKLYKYNPHLADGAVIWSEHLARQGRHDEAADVLISMKKRGIPVLTMGFRTALARISTYIHAGMAVEPLSELDRVLRYWAPRTTPNSPTTVVELDAEWSARVRKALGADS